MKTPKVSGLLVRVPVGAGSAFSAAATVPLRVSRKGMKMERLFSVEPPSSNVLGAAAASGRAWEWHVARFAEEGADENPWDLAHQAAAPSGIGLSSSDVFIEPDFIQEWPFENSHGGGAGALGAADATCAFNDQIAALPNIPGKFAWHRADTHSQLKTASGMVVPLPVGHRVRIGHLDTGYDPTHATLPQHLRADLQRNFVDDGQASNDAHDPAERGLLKNPGHGTGTLGILAGNRVQLRAPGYQNFNDFIGGAPDAEIIPIRVGTSVVQFRSSAVAAAINYAVELGVSGATAVHVLTMSMGGVASQAWADAVNKAYESGILYVAAAGNNYGSLPTRLIVYPARFRRVIAACGVMADGAPYFDLPINTMQGNWGPASKMATALSAYTPNMPWAELGCPAIVDMDGSGTSSATPQIAAAAALYLQQHAGTLFDRNRYPEGWMRVEAVRQALFASARRASGSAVEKLGNGILQAADALRRAPLAAAQLRITPRDSAILPLLNLFTGFGLTASESSNRMLALEATQLTQMWDADGLENPFNDQAIDPDLPAETIAPAVQQRLLAALHDHPRASRALRKRLGEMLSTGQAGPPLPPPAGKRRKKVAATPTPPPPPAATPAGLPPSVEPAKFARTFVPPEPAHRRLRGYALDPSLTTKLSTAPISRLVFSVPWEKLEPGPVGQYLEVIDIDPGSNCTYEPVDLQSPALLAQDGLEPSDGTPQFHQQMVYAVASLTIRNFEHALGRRTLWRPGPSPDPKNPKDDSYFVPRLRVYPHALRERNAYYSPNKIALLFGYFRADDSAPGEHLPGGMVFTALSHDIIAHETTHALLDGMNRAFLTPSNPDVHAFHEAFSDLVALFQHFTFPEIVAHQISTTRGEIRTQASLLGELAGEFGRGTGNRGALREAIGSVSEGVWKPFQPDPQLYLSVTESHQRGAILVAAIFSAFLSIYERRTADLVRLASNGTGILMPGAIHPDLVRRLADEAATSAQHVLTMCIRALDYCPLVDITFGEYLRAIITADYDLVPDDDLHYRVAFIEAFQKWGIYPRDVRTLSVESLLWHSPEREERRPSAELQARLAEVRTWVDEFAFTESRELIFRLERELRYRLHQELEKHFASGQTGLDDAIYLGLNPDHKFEVRTARLAFRTGPDGGMLPQLIVSMLQRQFLPGAAGVMFEGGCTVIADLTSQRIKYCIRKNIGSDQRKKLQRQFTLQSRETLRGVYLGVTDENHGEPFAIMHRGH